MIAPVVVDEAVKLTVVVVHVKVAGVVVVRFGVLISCVTVTLSIEVQPLAFLAVT
jgi:hypothetical protein